MAEGEPGWLKLLWDKFGGGTVSPLFHSSGAQIVTPPDKLIAGGGLDGVAPRIRTEPGEHSFFEKLQFRTFKEFDATGGTSIAAGATYVIKAVVPGDIILLGLDLILDNGQGKVETVIGGTPGGSFAETLPIFNQNNMAEEGPFPIPLSEVVLTAGGTHTGGTRLDVFRLKVATATGQASTIEAAQGTQRGVAANTYHIRVVNTGSGVLEGVLHANWEERP